MMAVVLAVLFDTHEMVADAVWESSLESASESSGGARTQRSCAGTRETENIRMLQDAEGPRHVTIEGFEDGRQQRQEQEKAQVQTSHAWQGWSGHEFQRNERVRSKRGGLEETGCVDVVSVDLNALEIGAVSLRERNHEVQSGIESCAAVTVFALLPMKSCKAAKSCKSDWI